jgi:hypothetical protein
VVVGTLAESDAFGAVASLLAHATSANAEAPAMMSRLAL